VNHKPIDIEMSKGPNSTTNNILHTL